MSARYIVHPNTLKAGSGKASHVVLDSSNPNGRWVYDEIGPYVYFGSEEECIKKAAALNYDWALVLMTEGTKAQSKGEFFRNDES